MILPSRAQRNSEIINFHVACCAPSASPILLSGQAVPEAGTASASRLGSLRRVGRVNEKTRIAREEMRGWREQEANNENSTSRLLRKDSCRTATSVQRVLSLLLPLPLPIHLSLSECCCCRKYDGHVCTCTLDTAADVEAPSHEALRDLVMCALLNWVG